jgi:hypothetical protein
MELGKRGKGKETDRALVIVYTVRCEGRGCKDAY